MTAATATRDTPLLASEVCTLPVVCLRTANFDLTVGDVIKGKNTIIDLWTTRCTRCPDALDTLNEFATSLLESYATCDDSNMTTTTASSIQCISICCGDTIDASREIIEKAKVPRWNNMLHYFMAYSDKEHLKQLLHFNQVPYYIVFDHNGALIYSGSKKMDWQSLLNASSAVTTGSITSIEQPQSEMETKMTSIIDATVSSPTSAVIVPTTSSRLHGEVALFVIDDMDF